MVQRDGSAGMLRGAPPAMWSLPVCPPALLQKRQSTVWCSTPAGWSSPQMWSPRWLLWCVLCGWCAVLLRCCLLQHHGGAVTVDVQVHRCTAAASVSRIQGSCAVRSERQQQLCAEAVLSSLCTVRLCLPALLLLRGCCMFAGWVLPTCMQSSIIKRFTQVRAAAAAKSSSDAVTVHAWVQRAWRIARCTVHQLCQDCTAVCSRVRLLGIVVAATADRGAEDSVACTRVELQQ